MAAKARQSNLTPIKTSACFQRDYCMTVCYAVALELLGAFARMLGFFAEFVSASILGIFR